MLGTCDLDESVTEAVVDIDRAWTEPTWFIDSDSPEVAEFVERAVPDRGESVDVAISLFHAVRDGIRYDPYVLSSDVGEYRASSVAGSESNWCVPKSVLLTAAARHCGIPARLGFADVKNHLTSPKLTERMGTDVFAWHGYSELLLDDRWFKLSSAFNIELCERFGVKALEFDGSTDALMHPYDEAGNRHMEYLEQRGSFDDLPLDRILDDFAVIYPGWMGRPAADTPSEETDDAFAAPDEQAT